MADSTHHFDTRWPVEGTAEEVFQVSDKAADLAPEVAGRLVERGAHAPRSTN